MLVGMDSAFFIKLFLQLEVPLSQTFQFQLDLRGLLLNLGSPCPYTGRGKLHFLNVENGDSHALELSEAII